jgi:hypothetical protein
MRLATQLDCTNRGYTAYTIHPESGVFPSFDQADPRSYEHFKNLKKPIEEMARNTLGEDFLTIELCGYDSGALYLLRVKTGTPKRRSADLRSFFGWVDLFDSIPKNA